MSLKVVAVSQLGNYLKRKLDTDPQIQNLSVSGEVSNITKHKSGHYYFTLKDNLARISCVMFKAAAIKISFNLKEGDKVVCNCNTSFFPTSGSLQLYVNSIKLDGVGDLYTKFEALKLKLSEQGLFNEHHKLQCPSYPMSIALVVGNKTAARHDILVTLKNRWPIAKISEYNCLVQGENASVEIISALLECDENNHDIIIIARGGGSIEDLWAFNDEFLANVIYNLKTFCITGIGHEIDFTIADFVADIRGATPTSAATLCTPDINDVINNVTYYQNRLEFAINNQLTNNITRFNALKNNNVLSNMDSIILESELKINYHNQKLLNYKNYFDNKVNLYHNYHNRFLNIMVTQLNVNRNNLSNIQNKLIVNMNNNLQTKINSFNLNIKTMDAYSPLKSLSRGYSVVFFEDKSLNSIESVKIDDNINIRLSDGYLNCQIKDKGAKL